MAWEPQVTIIGNLTSDPKLRFLDSGLAVASFTVASTPRVFDRQAGEWQDGDPLFMRCTLWADQGENAADSLGKGARVIVQGRLRQRSFTTEEGQKRTIVDMLVDEIAPSLRFATAQVTKTPDTSEF